VLHLRLNCLQSIEVDKNVITKTYQIPQIATTGNKVSFGEFGLQSTTRGRMTSRQIEAARRTITRHIKRGGRVWIRVFPDKPVSKKPLEVRMGKGKGNPAGQMLYELQGVSEELAREAFTLAAAKLPFKCKVVKRQVG